MTTPIFRLDSRSSAFSLFLLSTFMKYLANPCQLGISVIMILESTTLHIKHCQYSRRGESVAPLETPHCHSPPILLFLRPRCGLVVDLSGTVINDNIHGVDLYRLQCSVYYSSRLPAIPVLINDLTRSDSGDISRSETGGIGRLG